MQVCVDSKTPLIADQNDPEFDEERGKDMIEDLDEVASEIDEREPETHTGAADDASGTPAGIPEIALIDTPTTVLLRARAFGLAPQRMRGRFPRRIWMRHVDKL